jgi:hypothetical protein
VSSCALVECEQAHKSVLRHLPHTGHATRTGFAAVDFPLHVCYSYIRVGQLLSALLDRWPAAYAYAQERQGDACSRRRSSWRTGPSGSKC